MTKIEALKKTIYNLENNVYAYDWADTDCCNCGVLARTLLGGRLPGECGLQESPKAGIGGVFSSKAYCMTTGLNLPLVFKVIKEAGFTYEEMVELEYYGNKKIAEKVGFKVTFNGKFNEGILSWDNKQNAIKYFKAWVEILEEEKLNSEPLVKESDATMFKKVDEVGRKIIHIYHKVEVPETIQDSLPETILS